MQNRRHSKFSKISIVGLGYVGLPTAAAFAGRKIEVIGVDVNQEIVDLVNKGQIHIIEPELDIAVHAAVSSGYLKAVIEPEPADAFLVAVPTPFKDGNEPDLQFIENASKKIARVLKKDDLVILESTSPVGTTELMAGWMAEERPDLTFPHQAGEKADINVAHCPERILPGHTMRELIENDRVIGGMTDQCAKRASALYRIFVEGDLVKTDARTAELAKLTENAFRDVNIAFANELSLICNHLAIDVWELIALANRHPRVNVLKPGLGVGGHCIAVDPWFIVSSARDICKLIPTARGINDDKPDYVVQKIIAAVDSVDLEEVTIACLGLAFKPDVGDLRESPAVKIVKELLRRENFNILAVEPNIDELPNSLNCRNMRLCTIEEALDRSDVMVFLVAHKEFCNHPGLEIQRAIPVLDFVNLL